MSKKHSRGPGFRRRPVDVRDIHQRFLIVCEGEKTEPAYFQSFRGPHVVVRIKSANIDPARIVETAVKQWKEQKADYDQVWCVFDRDEVTVERFNRALELARTRNIKIAYSNPLFELWFLLHFQDCTGPLARQEYGSRLSQCLGRSYAKNDADMYDRLEPHMDDATRRAERLLDRYHPSQPFNDDPSTTVHLLVQELRRFSRP